MSETAQVRELLQRWLDLQQQGQPTPPEHLCTACPELLPQLHEQIAAIQAQGLPPSTDASSPSMRSTRADSGWQTAAPAPALPQRLAGYEILGVIGRGGMGVVYHARHPTLGIDVALKTMRFEAESAGLADRFLREARAVARLHHPHIVRLYDADEADGTHYFTMALVPGGSLQQRRAEYSGDAPRCATLMEKVARAVQHAHECGIIHRDLKPGNILLDEHGEPLVSDFGLAKFLQGASEQTTTGQVLGTAQYMAPEQAAGLNNQVGPPSDIWALGVILYELLAGRKPFEGKEMVRVLYEVQQSEPPRPSSVNHKVDRALETIVLKCLEKQPDRRYRSAGELADDLGRWLRAEPIVARPRPWPLRAWRRLRSKPWLPVAALALAMLAAVGGIWYVSGANSEGNPAPLSVEKRNAAQERQALQDGWQARLKRGDKVELVADRGLPSGLGWRTGEEEGKLFLTRDGFTGLTSANFALVEFLPRIEHKSLRFEGQVRHDDGQQACVVGLYFAHTEPKGGKGAHIFAALDFADHGWTPGRWALDLYSFVDPRHGEQKHFHSSGGLAGAFPAGGGMWHHLVVDLSPEGIKVACDGKQLGPQSWNIVNDRAGMALLPKDGLPAAPLPRFEPSGGIGLLVYRGTGAFRSVSLQAGAPSN